MTAHQLFQPFRLKSLELKNRIEAAVRPEERAVSPVGPGHAVHEHVLVTRGQILEREERGITRDVVDDDGVRKIARGESWVQDMAVPSELTENDMVGLRVRDRLTAKELRIVALIVQGYKNKEIATQLGTTEQVIKNYLRNVYDKIGVSDRLELALFTIHHRILNEAAAATAAAAIPQPSQSAGITN